MTSPFHTAQRKQPAPTLAEEHKRDEEWYQKYKQDKENFQKSEKQNGK